MSDGDKPKPGRPLLFVPDDVALLLQLAGVGVNGLGETLREGHAMGALLAREPLDAFAMHSALAVAVGMMAAQVEACLLRDCPELDVEASRAVIENALAIGVREGRDTMRGFWESAHAERVTADALAQASKSAGLTRRRRGRPGRARGGRVRPGRDEGES